jgi:hypothetical protein
MYQYAPTLAVTSGQDCGSSSCLVLQLATTVSVHHHALAVSFSQPAPYIKPVPAAADAQSIQQAHAHMAPALLEVSAVMVLGANINRSPTAYLNNPAAERARYKYDVDKTLTLLKVLDAQGRSAMPSLE